MKIDNRIFIPFAMPFVMLAMIRALFFLAGAAWIEPAVTGMMFFLLGGFVGVFLTKFMFARKYTIGFIQIGKVK